MAQNDAKEVAAKSGQDWYDCLKTIGKYAVSAMPDKSAIAISETSVRRAALRAAGDHRTGRRLPTICQAGSTPAWANRAQSYSVLVLSIPMRILNHRSPTLRRARP